jgi:CRISPR system Cascade subunit CasE
MYLSRLVLDPRSRRVQRESADPYQMHRSIMRAFPDDLPVDERVLFRCDADRRTGVLTVLVQSLYEPDWSWLDNGEGRGYVLDIGETNPDVKLFSLEPVPGQQLIFRLRANPTVKRDSKRHALWREEEQLDWLGRKADLGGFRALSVRLQELGSVQGWTANRNRLNLFAVQYEGVLSVTDPNKFVTTVQDGIGPGKGVGFGLLSLARSE